MTSDPVAPAPVARPWRRELGLLVGLCAVVGFVAGFIWYLVAPTPAFVLGGGRLVYRKDLPGEYIAMDGWFAVITFVAGVLVAVVALRRGPVTAWRVVAVPLAGLFGAWVAFRIGASLGPDTATLPSGRPVASDAVFHDRLDLSAKGVLLIWPVVSLGILTFALAFTSHDPRPKPAAGAPEGDGGTLVGGHPDLGDVDRG